MDTPWGAGRDILAEPSCVYTNINQGREEERGAAGSGPRAAEDKIPDESEQKMT